MLSIKSAGFPSIHPSKMCILAGQGIDGLGVCSVCDISNAEWEQFECGLLEVVERAVQVE